MKRKVLSNVLSKTKPILYLFAALLTLLPSVVMPAKVLAVPLAPTVLTAAIAVDPVTLLPTRTINLTWTDNAANELGFYVYRDTVNTFNSVNLVKTAAPASR